VSIRTLLKATLPASLLGATFTLALGNHTGTQRSASSAPAATVISVALPPLRQPGPAPPGPQPRARSFDERHPGGSAAQSATKIARRFLRRWLPCVYAHLHCARLPGLLPSYASILETELASTPAPPAGLTLQPTLQSLAVVSTCARAAVAIASYSVSGHRLQVHLGLVLDRAGWQVFNVFEIRARNPLPAPLRNGRRPC
jgi:hypothetical protein